VKPQTKTRSQHWRKELGRSHTRITRAAALGPTTARHTCQAPKSNHHSSLNVQTAAKTLSVRLDFDIGGKGTGPTEGTWVSEAMTSSPSCLIILVRAPSPSTHYPVSAHGRSHRCTIHSKPRLGVLAPSKTPLPPRGAHVRDR
jgi:hypothetical protein